VTWGADPAVVGGLYAAGAGYVWLARRRTAGARARHRGATASFLAGLVVVYVALESPLDALASGRLLSAHMVQHELLMSVAPPLLLLGVYPELIARPSRALLRWAARQHRTVAVLGSAPLLFALWLGLLYAWHAPRLYELALFSERWHIAQHASFLLAGLVFWLPALGSLPGLVRLRPAGVLAYLGLAQVGVGLLAALFIWSPVPLYPAYDGLPTLLGLTRAADQRLAGALMVAIDMTVTLAVAAWVVLRTLTRSGQGLQPPLDRGRLLGRP
jgi:putative membrane protein